MPWLKSFMRTMLTDLNEFNMYKLYALYNVEIEKNNARLCILQLIKIIMTTLKFSVETRTRDRIVYINSFTREPNNPFYALTVKQLTNGEKRNKVENDTNILLQRKLLASRTMKIFQPRINKPDFKKLFVYGDPISLNSINSGSHFLKHYQTLSAYPLFFLELANREITNITDYFCELKLKK